MTSESLGAAKRGIDGFFFSFFTPFSLCSALLCAVLSTTSRRHLPRGSRRRSAWTKKAQKKKRERRDHRSYLLKPSQRRRRRRCFPLPLPLLPRRLLHQQSPCRWNEAWHLSREVVRSPRDVRRKKRRARAHPPISEQTRLFAKKKKNQVRMRKKKKKMKNQPPHFPHLPKRTILS